MKIRRFLKKQLLILLASLTIFFSIFTSYNSTLQVRAASVVYTSVVELLQYLLASSGIVLSSSQIKEMNLNNSLFSDMKNGAETTLDLYKWMLSLDPTSQADQQAFAEVMLALRSRESALVSSVVTKFPWVQKILTNLNFLDKMSYKYCGTRVSDSFINNVTELFEKYKTSGSSALKEDISEAATILTFPSPDNDPDNDDDPLFGTGVNKANFLSNLAGMVALGALSYDWNSGESSSLIPLGSTFNKYDNTFFSAPDNFKYTGKIATDNNGNYIYNGYSYSLYSLGILYFKYSALTTKNIAGYCKDGLVSVYQLNHNNTGLDSFGISQLYYEKLYATGTTKQKNCPSTSTVLFGTSGYSSFNFPIFTAENDVLSYLKTGSDTNCINKVPSYSSFIADVPSSGTSIRPPSSLLDTDFIKDDLANISKKLDAIAVGQADTVPNINTAIDEVVGQIKPLPKPDPSPEPVPDPDPLPKPDPVPDNKADIIGSLLDGVIKLQIPILSDIVAWMKNIYNAIFSMTVPIIQTIPTTLKQIVGWTSTIPDVLTAVLANPFKWFQTAWNELMSILWTRYFKNPLKSRVVGT